jgi:2-polyprenyl-6-methoxyphenol hydroxylase-like FAD-dependent oxidoreductase
VVKTANGTSFQADAVICADGIHSRMRPFVLGEHVDPPASGESAYRLLIRVEDLQAVNHPMLIDGRLPPIMNMVTAKDRKILAYPIRDRTILNVVAYVRT